MQSSCLILLFFSINISFAQYRFNKLVWSDEFEQAGLPDSSKWNYDRGRGCPQLCGWGNNEPQFYTWDRLKALASFWTHLGDLARDRLFVGDPGNDFWDKSVFK